MLKHIVGLLDTSFATLPSRVGSNWGGLVFTAFLFIATELALWRFGDMKGRWTRSAFIGLGVVFVGWIGLFIISVVSTIYDDHQNLVGATSRIKRVAREEISNVKSESDNKLSRGHEQLSALQIVCAKQDGENNTLQRQNRDEQVLIAGCQSQALKLLTPEPLKVTPIVIEKQDQNVIVQTVKMVVLVNRIVTPIQMRIACDKQIENQSVSVAGSGIQMGGSEKVASNLIEVNIGSPAWGVISPLVVSISYRGGGDIQCRFIPR